MNKNNRHVLLIDDDCHILNAVSRALNLVGFTTLEARNGADGAAIYEAHRDCVAVVVIDYYMPGLNGEETAAQLREIDPTVAILFISSALSAAVQQRLLDAGAAGFLQKPFGLAQLTQAVTAVLAHRQLQPQLASAEFA